MIRSLEGTVSATGENYIVITVQGVGYLVYTPKVRVIVGDHVFMHTHLIVRENILDLYGFFEAADATFFELLMTIPKIGPKSALQILTQADASLLVEAISQNDPTPLQKIGGIGKKTAENIVSNLQHKTELLPKMATALTYQNALSPAQADAIDALITLGYDAKSAHTFVQKQDKHADTKTLIQTYLKEQPLG